MEQLEYRVTRSLTNDAYFSVRDSSATTVATKVNNTNTGFIISYLTTLELRVTLSKDHEILLSIHATIVHGEI